MRYTFGDHTLDLLRYEIRRAGKPLKLQRKVFDLLVYFIKHRDRVVTRQELPAALWPEQFVSDDALERAIAAVRRAVGDSGRAQRVLKTVHGRGYHFVAPVEEHRHEVPAEQPLPDPSKTQAALDHSPGLYPPDGERKQATVLLCKLTFPEMPPEGMDPETLHVLRHAFFTLARQEVQSYAGTIEHFVDDGFQAFFGAPVTYEDHPQRAVLAALSIQERLRQRRDDAASLPSGAVRMGLHTGPVIVGPVGDDHRQVILGLGDTTWVAEQLGYQAEPGAIVLSEVTGRAVQQFVRLQRIDPVHGQGTTMPYTAYKVLASLPQPAWAWQGRRVVRQFVGREYEMATVRALLAHVEEGRGQVVGIVGEPGIGKSRLLYEFRQHVAGRSLTYLPGRCLAYGQTTPYLLLRDLLRHACGMNEQDTAEMMAIRVRQHLQNIGMAPEEWAPYVFHLLGMQEGKERLAALSSQAIRTHVFETLLQMNIQTSQHRPLLVVVEDLHWIDPTSEEWLALLVERLAGVPILALTSYRPGYHPTWMDKSYVTQLALQRLTTDDSRRLVQAVFHPTTVPEPLMLELLTKAGGNPFFLEELAQTVVEHGAPHSPLTIPQTVQTVLAARMDRLPPGAKYLLQVASVIGTEIPVPLLQVVSGLSDTALQQHLRSLQGTEFLFETRSLPACAYTFKHALTQEAAYQSLL